MNLLIHPHTHTENSSNTSFSVTLCTYWVLIQPAQRGLITHISECWLNGVGTTHEIKILYTGLQILCMRMCVCLSLECELHCTLELVYAHDVAAPGAPEQNSHRHPSIQRRMMDIRGLATNYSLYTDEGGWPSCLCLWQYVYLLERKRTQ